MKNIEKNQNKEQAITYDRREFLKLLGGGVFILFNIGDSLAPQSSRRRSREYPEDFNAYLRIGEDGRVACYSGKIEMGQGVITSLGQMLAEELDVSVDMIDMVMGDTSLCPYDMGTFGSRSTKYFGPALRQGIDSAPRERGGRNIADKGSAVTAATDLTIDAKPGEALSASVLVLNRLFTAVRVVNVRRAFVLLYKRLAEVVSVEDGAFVGRADNEKLYGLLVSDKQFKDFTVRFKFKCLSGDSGFYIRTIIKEPEKAHGLQVQVGLAGSGVGGIYESYGRAWIDGKPDIEREKKYTKTDDWNEMVIDAHGGDVVVKVNGTKTAELKGDKSRPEGHFALQMHAGCVMHVMFKEIKICEE